MMVTPCWKVSRCAIPKLRDEFWNLLCISMCACISDSHLCLLHVVDLPGWPARPSGRHGSCGPPTRPSVPARVFLQDGHASAYSIGSVQLKYQLTGTLYGTHSLTGCYVWSTSETYRPLLLTDTELASPHRQCYSTSSCTCKLACCICDQVPAGLN
jgi:hypothetical protein